LRPLVGVLAAIAVSLTGTRVSAIALPWFVLSTTGSATLTGVVAFCEMTPYVLVKAFTGPLVDRIGPRAVSWTADLVSACAAGAVPLLHVFMNRGVRPGRKTRNRWERATRRSVRACRRLRPGVAFGEQGRGCQAGQGADLAAQVGLVGVAGAGRQARQ
jgi:MFS family permease